MKRRYKLLLILAIGLIATIIINGTTVHKKISIVTLGDGFSLGMTPYNVAGTSFNDYLKEKFEKANKLDSYNNEYSISHLTTHELKELLEDNVRGNYTKIPIKQTIAKAEIVTVAIGVDEFADKSLVENITNEKIEDYLKDMESVLKTIRDFYEKKVIVIGVYPAYKFDKKDAIEVNSKLKILCGKYNVDFLDVLAISLNPKYYLEEESYYMNYKAHEEIAKMLYVMYKNPS